MERWFGEFGEVGSVDTCPVGDHMLVYELLGNEVGTELEFIFMFSCLVQFYF